MKIAPRHRSVKPAPPIPKKTRKAPEVSTEFEDAKFRNKEADSLRFEDMDIIEGDYNGRYTLITVKCGRYSIVTDLESSHTLAPRGERHEIYLFQMLRNAIRNNIPLLKIS